ncbi:MAG: acetyl-CoA carboxylase biotin carboxylase subunit [Sterolibacterium sp.]|jgi:3-methylcrotonyl-CoA carboxylase alpha subunit|nr:acetyl-CoA carboxylase biotin carboxylase subunit [Sterolibacterium sp.]
MFEKILIANRGEIACRVIRTARRLGIRTVAVYSTVDAGARHVRLADEAVCIGSAEARDSYLCIDRLIEACQRSGAQAVHPGYGFLAENAAFARACARAGVVFIGPTVEAIEQMGCKAAAKALMAAAGVPLAPGYHGAAQGLDFLREQAAIIGYPVLIKATAGGGGKGMRVVRQAAEFADALAACQRVAVAAFGDARVLIEKYLERPRHIEIQVFGDTQGHCIHLFERDCSVQRRHQKVLEEAPAPGMSAECRTAMGQAAVAAARAVGYVGAGTVEFIVDMQAGSLQNSLQDAPYYFMEMNTRLQVEHPVTEMITGLDLVEWQLRIAAGEPLPLAQAAIPLQGHALEARLYAEDADKDFLPSSGTLRHLVLPQVSVHVRVDSGVETGDAITPYYDPMIAKLIVHDVSRERALLRLQQALAQTQVVGLTSNVGFLSRLLASPAYRAGALDTHWIEREQAAGELSAPERMADPMLAIAALAELLRAGAAAARPAPGDEPHSPWRECDGWRLNGVASRRLLFRQRDQAVTVIAQREADGYRLLIDGRPCHIDGVLGSGWQLRVACEGQSGLASVVVDGERRHVFYGACAEVLSWVDPLAQGAGEVHAESSLRAPMPGKVVSLLAQTDVLLVGGAPLLVMEAMKMEHTIRAPEAGIVRRFLHAAGDQVTEGAELVEFEAANVVDATGSPS